MAYPQPSVVDMTRPNVARVYDYALGGKDHFAVDRALAERVIAIYPVAPLTIKEGRAFVGRAVRHLAEEAGIRQFIDVGSGLPTTENVHEVAQRVAPDTRVVYVDHDPVAVSHGQAILAVGGNVAMIEADVRKPQEIINHPELNHLIDFDEPVAILMTQLLQWLTDDEDPADVVAQFRDAMVSGSYMVINQCHIPDPDEDRAYRRPVEAMFCELVGTLRSRTHDEILGFFDGFELVEPGLVPVTDWRPDVPHLLPVPTWDELNDSLGEPSPEVAAVIVDRNKRRWLLAGGVGRKP